MFMNIATGADARVAGADAISGNDLGVRYSGFRDLDRFEAQTQGMNIGHISWPGGALAEAYPDRYGLNYDGLFNPATGQPGLTEMMAYANDTGASLSVVLPTARYANDLDQLRADMREFMGDLLGGDYGPLPQGMFLHIGSEHYAHFQGLTADGAAAGYGRVAAAMVEEIQSALQNPAVNLIGADVEVAVQAGRTLPEDTLIRESFSEELLAEVDLVTHHRYAAQADGIDAMLRQFRPINNAWREDVVEAGGEAPQINLGEWNVASITRNEAASRYIRDMDNQGQTVTRAELDLEGRTNTRFEQYYQSLLDTRDYGAAQPQLYLEMFSEYAAEGLGAASIHAADLIHPGRMTFSDVEGNPVRFVGAELIDMLYESVEGTHVLQVSEANRPNSPIATYGFESDARLVLFVAADENAVLGDVTLNIEGLNGGYTAIWTDSLVAEVPEDWMERFGVIDNPNVDESNEGETYALGVRSDLDVTIRGNQMSFAMTEPGQTVRIMVARTPAEAARIAEWAGAPDYGTAAGTPGTGGGTTPPVTGGGDDVTDDDAGDDDTPADPAPQGPSWTRWLMPSFGGSSSNGQVPQPPVTTPSSNLPVPEASGGSVPPAPAPRPPMPPVADDADEPAPTVSVGRSVSDWLASFRGGETDSFREPVLASMRGQSASGESPRSPMAQRQAEPTAQAAAEAPLPQVLSIAEEDVDSDAQTEEDAEEGSDKSSSLLGELTSVMSALSGIATGGMLMAITKGLF